MTSAPNARQWLQTNPLPPHPDTDPDQFRVISGKCGQVYRTTAEHIGSGPRYRRVYLGGRWQWEQIAEGKEQE